MVAREVCLQTPVRLQLMAGALSMSTSTPVTKLWEFTSLRPLRADQQGQYKPLVIEGDDCIYKVTKI